GPLGFLPPATGRFALSSHSSPTPGTSGVTPLRPLVERLLVWLNLPNPSRWLLRTIRLSYAIQFARRRYRGILFTYVRGENAVVLRAEIAVLLAKDAIENVPSAAMKKGFFLSFFLSSAKMKNRALHKLPFKMLTLKHILTCVRAQDWFVATDLKDTYFHVSILPRHRPFLWFAFEGLAFQYKVLPFGLSLLPHVFTKVMEAALAPLREVGIRILNYLNDWLILAHSQDLVCTHRNVVPNHLARLGLRVNWEKSKLSPTRSNSFLCVELDSVNMTFPRLCTVSAEVHESSQTQNSSRPEILSEAPGAHGILSRGHAARPDANETAAALASYPSPEMDMATRQILCEHHTLVSQNLQPQGRPSAALAYQLPGVVDSAFGPEEVSTLDSGQACVDLNRQHSSCGVHQPPGRCTLILHVTTDPPSPTLKPAQIQVSATHIPGDLYR
ncbi:hypothetical protein M9458_022264, partial [Cirrhinus mrigala]